MDSPKGKYYWAICTEFCNGGDLRSLFEFYVDQPNGRIPEVLIWKFIADLIRILEFLSKNRIEHQDIYPQDIFLRYPYENLDVAYLTLFSEILAGLNP
jgi:serine/threonine protein kinase